MDKQSPKLIGLFVRYLSLMVIGANLYFFREILTRLTVQASNWTLSLFSPTMVTGNIILFNGIIIEIISACVATSAFFLLVLLILSTPDIKPGKRSVIIIFSLIALFILNILRITILAGLAKSHYFNVVHWASWHLISIFFVVGIWFTMVKIYKIESIPMYSDITYLQKLIKKPRKNPRRSKKHN